LRLSIKNLQFQKHLNSVSSKPAAAQGPEQMFSLKRTDELIELIDRFNQVAGSRVA
jgi:hypothetical protein